MNVFVKRKMKIVYKTFFAFLMVFTMGMQNQKLEAKKIIQNGLDFEMSSNWYATREYERVELSTCSWLTVSNKCVEFYARTTQNVYRDEWNCGKSYVTNSWVSFSYPRASGWNQGFVHRSVSSDHWHQGFHWERSRLSAVYG